MKNKQTKTEHHDRLIKIEGRGRQIQIGAGGREIKTTQFHTFYRSQTSQKSSKKFSKIHDHTHYFKNYRSYLNVSTINELKNRWWLLPDNFNE